MAWTNVTITLNTDNPNIGDVSATWNQGLPDAFTFTARGNTSQIPAFVAAAKAAQAAYAAKLTNLNTLEASILTQLNT